MKMPFILQASGVFNKETTKLVIPLLKPRLKVTSLVVSDDNCLAI